jgi:hypothetical protein
MTIASTSLGFTGDPCTVARIGKLISRELGVAYHPSHA